VWENLSTQNKKEKKKKKKRRKEEKLPSRQTEIRISEVFGSIYFIPTAQILPKFIERQRQPVQDSRS